MAYSTETRADLHSPIFRRTHGREFSLLLSGLHRRIAGEPRLQIDGTRRGGWPLLVLAKRKELMRGGNFDALAELDISRDVLMQHVSSRVPGILDAKPAVFDDLRHSVTREGFHFVDLKLDDTSGQEAYDERTEVWHALEEIADTQLEWKSLEPDVTVLHGGINPEPMTRSEVAPAVAYIKAQLPIELMLTSVRGIPS